MNESLTTTIPAAKGFYWLSGHRHPDGVTRYNIQHDGTANGDYKLDVLVSWGTWGQAYKLLAPITGADSAAALLRLVTS